MYRNDGILIALYPHYMAATTDTIGPTYFDWRSIKFGLLPPFRTDRTIIYKINGGSPRKVEMKRYPYDGHGTVYLSGHFHLKETTSLDG
jgi:hypothetical protein